MKLALAVMSDTEIRAVSFGAVSVAVRDRLESWRECRKTLYDPATFGPEANWRYACGKYVGERYEHMICDICGVKIAARADVLRRERFGHINLAVHIRHPLDQSKLIGTL